MADEDLNWDELGQQHLHRMDPATGEREILGPVTFPEPGHPVHIASAKTPTAQIARTAKGSRIEKNSDQRLGNASAAKRSLIIDSSEKYSPTEPTCKNAESISTPAITARNTPSANASS